jgi:transcription initiation factor TFIIH subunit 2
VVRQQNSVPVRRTIIRHLTILLDLSDTMTEKDLRPSRSVIDPPPTFGKASTYSLIPSPLLLRFDLTLEYVREFVAEWFDQNPLGQVRLLSFRAHGRA